MDIGSLKQTARARLESASYDPRRLALIHTGAALGVSVLLTVVSFVVDRQIGNTGGLSGIGLRSVLSTVQTVLQGVAGLLLPFWQIGFLAAALAFARGGRVTPMTLTQGFLKFRPVLRLMILQLLATIGIGLACVYVSSFAFMMTPLAEPLFEILEPALQETALDADVMLSLDEATLVAATDAMMPAVAIALVLFGVVMLFVGYRFRIAKFVVLEENAPVRGIGAVLKAMKLLRRRSFRFFRLDLQFWWYYLLQMLLVIVGYGETLLYYLGVELPLPDGVGFFLFFGLQVVGQLILLTRARPLVETTYALFYEGLKEEVPTPPVQPNPQHFNWDV